MFHEVSGLLGHWFELKTETHTTDFVADEIERGGYPEVQSNFKSKRIKIHSSTSEQISQCYNLSMQHPGLSISDVSVCLLAEELDAMLLTSDQPLEKIAKGRHINVHGTLWIFDQLISSKVLTPSMAAAKLQHLLNMDRYLPKEECRNRIKKWREVGS